MRAKGRADLPNAENFAKLCGLGRKPYQNSRFCVHGSCPKDQLVCSDRSAFVVAQLCSIHSLGSVMRRKERDAKLVYHNPGISRCLLSQSVSCTLKWREAASLGEIATSATKGLALCGRVAVDFAQCKSFAIRQEVSPIITLPRTGQRTNSETDHHPKTRPEASTKRHAC